MDLAIIAAKPVLKLLPMLLALSALALTDRPVERVVACAPFDVPAEAVRQLARQGIPGGQATALAVNAAQRLRFGADAALRARDGLDRRPVPALILQEMCIRDSPRSQRPRGRFFVRGRLPQIPVYQPRSGLSRGAEAQKTAPGARCV